MSDTESSISAKSTKKLKRKQILGLLVVQLNHIVLNRSPLQRYHNKLLLKIKTKTVGQHMNSREKKDLIPVHMWCKCGNCGEELLSDAREFRCCRESIMCKLKF